jgi:cell wall-associated NlpC family hydrolase
MAATLMLVAVMTVGIGGAKAAGSIVVGGIGHIAGNTGDKINIRSGPSTAYDVNVQLNAGEAVEVYDGPRTDKNGNVWYKVRNENGGGWVSADYLTGKSSSKSSSSANSSTNSTQQASSTGSAAKIKIGGAVKVTDDNLRIRSQASKSGTVLATVDGGYVLKVDAGPVTDKAGNSWYQVSGKYTTGWVSADYIVASKAAPPTLVSSSDTRSSGTTSRGGARDTTPPPSVTKPVPQATAPKPQAATPQVAQAAKQVQAKLAAPASSGVIATAEKYLGYRYVYGGASPRGFDCSGFVAYVLNRNGFGVSRDMYGLLDSGTRIKSSQLQAGDLVFFANTYKPGVSHVGIYIGGGKFIHAENENTGVVISELWNSYYSAHYYTAVRVSR